jgi:hypothetical protein
VSFLGLCVLVLVVLSGPACRKAPPTQQTGAPKVDTPGAPNEPAAQTPADKPAVTVNGTVIGEQELSKRLALVMRQYKDRMANLPPQYVEQVEKQIRQTALDNLITETLLEEQMKTAQIEVPRSPGRRPRPGPKQAPSASTIPHRPGGPGGQLRRLQERVPQGAGLPQIPGGSVR